MMINEPSAEFVLFEIREASPYVEVTDELKDEGLRDRSGKHGEALRQALCESVRRPCAGLVADSPDCS